ncbi:hypothetical protein LEP1GSC151_3606 [Leptospira interrogans serovar Grippotyphosa str. LT2186]|uniref:Uncharacterized protein n=1 Tax=Leptospira interrogans serovar Grippotyphosa str. LT2186 TaxID=1001599 RepID=M3IC46_LEPIR|nr:hypothetical protein LIL_12169 [Leptospira interrogans serovar Linhai str. 56609]EKR47043.1 hypothetical protein LEP1GSC097_0310 [Leptospira interrogans serovar Grippotyphosa str. UI 08368]EMG13477.1 hypothetical protein LEP1GSC151_3606 [Leptospira interrogans serovar Grippotyphosa str. LT2186]EMN65072.1 hypothetical protein LEP1GSC098_4105 [Leptospira interrogans serovar Grippotyphosa str. UI 08434]EMN85453.1 hypothetical protein LEP1GSC107_2442 [Leptospira interrogans serovar Grippotyphosa
MLISAEAIFLSSGGSDQGELKYRLAHRTALFLESEPKKQKEIFDFMKKAMIFEVNLFMDQDQRSVFLKRKMVQI